MTKVATKKAQSREEQEKICLEALAVQAYIREIVYRRTRSFHGNSRGKFGDYRGDRGDHDCPDRTRLTGAIAWKPGFKDIGIPRIFILIILPKKISDTTNESDYIQTSTARDIKTVRANYSEPRTMINR